MKMIIIPRSESHVRKDGRVYCVTCRYLCMRRRCWCCRMAA